MAGCHFTKVTVENDTCYYDIEFTRNKQRRELVKMESLRMPLEEKDDVEVFSKRDWWKVGQITGNPNSATSVGYTVSTDSGTFAKVPAHRFRRRFPGGTAVEYYRSVYWGWQDATIYGDPARQENGIWIGDLGQAPAGKLVGKPREIEWLQQATDSGFKKFRPNDQAEQGLGPAVTADPKSSLRTVDSAASTATPQTTGAAVGQTPLPSEAPGSELGRAVGTTPAASLLPGESKIPEDIPIEPWTEVAIVINESENAGATEELKNGGCDRRCDTDTVEKDGFGPIEVIYMPLWRVRKKKA